VGALPSKMTFGPWTGYVSSVPRHMLPPDKISADSQNVYVSPFDGSLRQREGTTIYGDTLSGGLEVTGLLEQKFSGRVRHMVEMDSPSFSDGLPVISALVTNETNSGYVPGAGGADSGFRGSVYVRNHAGATNYSFLQEFGNPYYPAYGATGGGTLTSFNMKVVPSWYESGDGGYTRGAFQFSRLFFTGGSRKMVDAGAWRYLSALRSTPIRWNRRINTASSGLTEPVRVFPTGAWGPLFPPRVQAGTASTGSDAVWSDGDFFYCSVMFQFEDGSFSIPFTPRAINGRLSAGLGAITVGTIGGTSKYRNLAWDRIPIGPDGTIARVLLRSPKQTLATSSDVITVSYGNLQICGVLRNNTQTSFTDTLGADAGLLDDVNIVRQDWALPRRARVMGTGDQRVVIGYSLPNPCAIMLAPTGSAAARDLNLADTGSISGANAFLVRITSTQVELHKLAAPAAPAAGTQLNLDYATYATLQDMVDAINATTTASNCGEWAAALAPGIDGSTASSSLCPTTADVTTVKCTTGSPTLTNGNFANIPVGAKIRDTTANFPADTYVLSKQSSTSITMNANATATDAVGHTATFYSDTGDEANVTGGTHGYMRAFAPSLPVVMALKTTSQVGYERPEKSSVYFTVSSPGAATTGVSLAANAWASANKRTAPGKIGAVMAVTDIEGAAVVEYSSGRRLFINQRGVTSGEDFDYRLLTINDRRGAISAASCVSINNVAVCLTQQGLVATDKSRREVVISNDIHNPTTNDGNLWVEINKCWQGAQADDDTGLFNAAVLGTQLHICYRLLAANTTPARRHVYDFALGAEASGLDEIVSPKTGAPYGWSAPFTKGYGAVLQLARDAGPVTYGWSDTNKGSTGDGRLDTLDDGSGTDNGNSISAAVYMAAPPSPPYQKWQAIRGWFMYASPNGTATVTVYPTRDRTGSANVTLPVTTDDYETYIAEYAQSSRATAETYEARWVNTTQANILYQHVAELVAANIYQS
jgi:hypothetical protein